MRTMAEGGARELRLPDWPFGAVGRRLLLEALLLEDEQEMPKEGWSKSALEEMADVGSGGIDEVLAGALQLKLVELRDGRWRRPSTRPPVAGPLLALVEATRRIPDEPIEPIPRRAYRRRSDTGAA